MLSARTIRASAALNQSKIVLAINCKRPVSRIAAFKYTQPATQVLFNKKNTFIQTRNMSEGAHPHMHRNELFDMTGFTAVVTGGGTGIGLMITLALVENGCKVFITSRDKSKLEDVVKRYGGDGKERGEIIPVEVDITSKDSLVNAVKAIEPQAPKGIQILFNNAGIAGEGAREGYEAVDKKHAEAISAQLWKSETSEWDAILRTNVTSQYFTAAAFLPLLAKGKDSFKGYASQIINTTSISGVLKKASGGQYAYAASKAAMFQFTKVLATELLETGIRVNQLVPGVFGSQMTAGGTGEDHKSSLEGTGKGTQNPAGRPGDEKDMAGAVLFLASRAGVYLNGQELHPDGGATLSGPSSL